MDKRIVIESPLSGDFQHNYRYLLWCCRAVWEVDGLHAIASHMINPWFMDDEDQVERNAGIGNPWVWMPDVAHVFFIDLGMSRGMNLALLRCRNRTAWSTNSLNHFYPDHWTAFQRGEWPPHTRGFEIAGEHD